MDRQHGYIIIAAYLIHVVLIFILPVLTILKEDFLGANTQDYSIFMNCVDFFLTNPPADFYVQVGSGFNWMPAYLYVYLPFYFLSRTDVWSFLWVQVGLFAPCLYFAGDVLSKKSMPRYAYGIFLFLFAGMWIFTNSYRVGNDKVWVLTFFMMALWAVETRKHPLWAAIGFSMAVSRVIYFAPLFLYYIFDKFEWKKFFYSVAVFVALNSLFLIYPPLIWTFALNAAGLGMSSGFFTAGHEYNAPYGLFTYLRIFLPGYTGPIFISGAILLLGCFIILWWRKYPLSHLMTYYPMLIILFFPVIEHTHYTYLLPPLVIFYAQQFPATFLGKNGKISIDALLKWIPFLCLIACAEPIPSALVEFLPAFLRPFRILAFSLLFFILTAKKGLLWPFFKSKENFVDNNEKERVMGEDLKTN